MQYLSVDLKAGAALAAGMLLSFDVDFERILLTLLVLLRISLSKTSNIVSNIVSNFEKCNNSWLVIVTEPVNLTV